MKKNIQFITIAILILLTMILPQQTAFATAGDRAYLESDIFGKLQSTKSGLTYPKNGSITIDGESYYRGIHQDSSSNSAYDAILTYNIEGENYVKLIGVFGLCNYSPYSSKRGNEGGTLTISGDGKFLGGFENKGGKPTQIEVDIPAGTKELVVRIGQIQDSNKGARFGFADAYLLRGTPAQPSTPSNDAKPTPPPLSERQKGPTGVAGNYYYTDIVVYLWNTPVNAINVGGAALIDAESLAYYGFNVKWWPDDRMLTIYDQNTSSVSAKAKDGSLLDMKGGSTGVVAGQYYHTDIITYLNGVEITCFNTGGRAFIDVQAMSQFGYKVVWNGTQRTLVISR